MTKNWSTTKIIQVAKAVKRTINQDGQTFQFAPIGCDPAQISALRRKGFYVLTELATGIEGLGWKER